MLKLTGGKYHIERNLFRHDCCLAWTTLGSVGRIRSVASWFDDDNQKKYLMKAEKKCFPKKFLHLMWGIFYKHKHTQSLTNFINTFFLISCFFTMIFVFCYIIFLFFFFMNFCLYIYKKSFFNISFWFPLFHLFLINFL